MKIYLGVCCLNRPFDDQTQDRVHLESEAVVLILQRFRPGNWEWISSEALNFEVRQTPDIERRQRVESLLRYTDRTILMEASVVNHACELKAIGFGVYDALNLAFAEHSNAAIFLTTDDKLLRLARGCTSQINVMADNPLVWLREVIENEYRNHDS